MKPEKEGLALEKGRVLHGLFKEVFFLHEVLASVMDRVHELSGLSTPQRRIMETIRKSKFATVPDIAKRLGVSRQFVQTVCNNTVQRGYLEFRKNPKHKRSQLVVFTQAGEAKLELAQRKEEEMIGHVMNNIDLEKASEVRNFLEALRKGIESSALVAKGFS